MPVAFANIVSAGITNNPATTRGMSRCDTGERPRLSSASICSVTRMVPSSAARSEEHTSELQSHSDIVCRLLLEKKKDTAKHNERHSVARWQMLRLLYRCTVVR